MIMPWECSECLKKGFSIGIEKIKKKAKQEAKVEFVEIIKEARMKFMGSINKKIWDEIFDFLEAKLEEK